MTEAPRQLNLGCGFDGRQGFVNADSFPECEPDVLMDIETHPWPFVDDAFDYILMKHVLEHVGADFAGFKAVMQDLYRVAAPGGIIEIHVPDYRHETYWSDPTHVRAFTYQTFEMMSAAKNRQWMAERANFTMLAFAMKVDFEIEQAERVYDPFWLAKVKAGEMTREQLRRAGEDQWGVVREMQIKIRAVKPRSPSGEV